MKYIIFGLVAFLVITHTSSKDPRCDYYYSLLNESKTDSSNSVYFDTVILFKSSFLVFADSMQNLRLFSLPYLNPESTFPSLHTSKINSLVQIGYTELIASASNDNYILVHNTTNNGSILYNFTNHTAAVKTVVNVENYNPLYKNMNLLASGDEAGKIFIWDALSGKILNSFKETNPISSLISVPAYNAIVYSTGNEVKSYDLFNMEFYANISLLTAFIPDSLSYSYNLDSVLASSSTQKWIYIFNITGENLQKVNTIDVVAPNGIVTDSKKGKSYLLHPQGNISFFLTVDSSLVDYPMFESNKSTNGPLLWLKSQSKLFFMAPFGINMYDFSLGEPAALNGLCYSYCPDGYYWSLPTFPIKLCSPCDEYCQTCSASSSYCSTCKVNYLLFGNQCLDQCPPNSYAITSNETCACNTGYYLDTINDLCSECSKIHCSTSCTSSGLCKVCDYGYYLNTGRCLSCSFPCKSCSSSGNCYDCSYGYELIGGACKLKCNSGQYRDQFGYCSYCYYRCGACTGGLSNNCLSCSSDIYEYSNGQCELVDNTVTIFLAIFCPIFGSVVIIVAIAIYVQRRRRRNKNLRNTPTLLVQPNPVVQNVPVVGQPVYYPPQQNSYMGMPVAYPQQQQGISENNPNRANPPPIYGGNPQYFTNQQQFVNPQYQQNQQFNHPQQGYYPYPQPNLIQEQGNGHKAANDNINQPLLGEDHKINE